MKIREFFCWGNEFSIYALRQNVAHAFVASRVGYHGSLLIDALKTVIDNVQRPPNAAARIASNFRKCDRKLRQFRRRELQCLDVNDRVGFVQSLCVQMFIDE